MVDRVALGQTYRGQSGTGTDFLTDFLLSNVNYYVINALHLQSHKPFT
jgi:hypothetical protein